MIASSRLPANKPLPHHWLSPSSLVPFDFVDQIARQRGAWPAFLRHPVATRRLETENAVFSGDIAGHRNAAFPGVGCRRSTPGNGDTSTTASIVCSHILNCLCSGICIAIKRHLRGSSIALHGIGGSAVTAVQAAVLAQELVIRLIGLVTRAARKGVGHGERARHCAS